MGLGNCFHLGVGKEYSLKYNNLNRNIILIVTQKDENGGVWGHCMRMAAITDESFKALDPSKGIVDAFQWDFLIKHECLIYVIGRSDLSI